ncbi:C-type lectin 1-like [Penaeus vannamei]|uniref:C-type lectin 1-like n=1 Tax=Penaeus vannamei TaxID=6689 RepID=UPI00387F46EA
MGFCGIRVLALSLLLAAARANVSSQLWHSVKANGTTLSSGTPSDLGVLPLLTCAIHATQSADLFCHDQNICSLYDMKLPAVFDDSIHGPALPCWTKCERKCIPPFDTSSGLGCFYFSAQAVDFDTARATCHSLCGDLAVPDDALAFFNWVQATRTESNIWVGTRAREWIDGRPISVNEWAPGIPNGDPLECARMLMQGTGEYRIDDKVCTNTYPFMCEIK